MVGCVGARWWWEEAMMRQVRREGSGRRQRGVGAAGRMSGSRWVWGGWEELPSHAAVQVEVVVKGVWGGAGWGQQCVCVCGAGHVRPCGK